MAKRITCPACDARGEVGDDVGFETRGRMGARAVQRCLNCGSGLFVKPPFGQTAIVPHDLWLLMQQRWAAEVPEAEGDDDEMPVIAEALQSLFDEEHPDLAPCIFVLACAAQDLAGVALGLVAREHPEWAQLELGQAKAVIRSAATYFVMIASKDEGLRPNFAQCLDVKPSEVEAAVANGYNAAFLSASEATRANTALQKWNDGDPSGHGMALGRLIWHASGDPDTPPIDEVLQWRAALNGLRDPFRSHLVAELEEVARDPGTATPGSAGSVGRWLPDPTARHELRYWCGQRWTEHVSDAGVGGIDPLPTTSAGRWAPDPTARHQWRLWTGSEWSEHVNDAGAVGVDPMP